MKNTNSTFDHYKVEFYTDPKSFKKGFFIGTISTIVLGIVSWYLGGLLYRVLYL